MFPIGMIPPQDLMQDLPGDVPVEAAIAAWQAGLKDALEDRAPYTFPEFEELQPLYDNGYARGDKAVRIARIIDARPGGTPAQQQQQEAKERVASPRLVKARRAIDAITSPYVLGSLMGVLLGLLIIAGLEGVLPWQ